MLLQCAAIVAIFLSLRYATIPTWLLWTRSGLIWGAILLTIVSGIEYVLMVIRVSKAAEVSK